MKPAPLGEESFVLSSGRKFYAHALVLGIYSDTLLCNGYDEVYHRDVEHFSPAEKVEIADYMIGQWTAFRKRHAKMIRRTP